MRKESLTAPCRHLSSVAVEPGTRLSVSVDMFMYNARRRKTTVILFKILGIERAWNIQGSVGRRPRQIFITKSRRLANKVEEDYVNLLSSLCNGFDMPEDIQERIQRWKGRKKMDTFDLDDGEDHRRDLPQTYSELLDGHFPLFTTTNKVSIMPVLRKWEEKLMYCVSRFFRVALQPPRGGFET